MHRGSITREARCAANRGGTHGQPQLHECLPEHSNSGSRTLLRSGAAGGNRKSSAGPKSEARIRRSAHPLFPVATAIGRGNTMWISMATSRSGFGVLPAPERRTSPNAGCQLTSAVPPTADINSRQRRAKPQSRCAPARWAGARAERPVASRGDSDSGVAKSTRSTSALFGVQRMIKHIEMICAPAP
jgi:hypothetical protein